MDSPHILVVSENPANARTLYDLLTERSCHPDVATSEVAALLRVRQTPPPDLILLELDGGRNPWGALEKMRSQCPEVNVVVVSAHNDTRQVVEAIRLGARDYLTIPLRGDELERVIRRHAQDALSRTPFLIKDPVENPQNGQVFVAASSAMQKIRLQAERLANIDHPVLILGETWSGKAALARLIHRLSSRSSEHFARVNCAAFSGELLERELFGSEERTLAGAERAQPGKLELCDQGTILINDVAEMPTSLQAKLLHLLQERQLFRLGGECAREANVRILAAMNAKIDAVLANGKLSEDLYYRLGAFVIHLPPLREHREDIPALLHHFMAKLAAQYSRFPVAFSPAAMDACLHYSWPGNLKELENFVKRYLVMGEEAIAHSNVYSRANQRQIVVAGSACQEKASPRLDKQAANDEVPTCHLKSMVRDLKDETEIRAIMQALRETRWNRKRAARLLGISYRGLLYKIRQHSLTQEPEPNSPTPIRVGMHTNRQTANTIFHLPEA